MNVLPTHDAVELIQIVQYLIVGGLVTVADLVLYNALTGPAMRLPRISANFLSVTCGMALGFTLHFALVFHPAEPLVGERLLRYVVTVGVSVYGVQNLVIFTLAELWRSPVHLLKNVARNFPLSAEQSADFIDRMTGKAAAAVAGMAWNFIMFKFFVYA